MKNALKVGLAIGLVFALGACASKKTMTSAEALKDLNDRYSEKVGKANKTELVEEFGTADWCERKPSGVETCRFYKSVGVQFRGDKEKKTRYETFDEVVAEFDAEGTLRDYKARSQR